MKKKEWLILAAFLAGILAANLSGRELLSSYGILNRYYLNQYTGQNIDCDRLFGLVLLERLKAALFVVVLGKMIRGKKLFWTVECFLAMTFGFLMAAAVANLGIVGILILIGGTFPQWLFYQADLFLYAESRAGMEQSARYGKNGKKEAFSYGGMLLIFTVIFLLGVIMESYVNPFLFDKILKIF